MRENDDIVVCSVTIASIDCFPVENNLGAIELSPRWQFGSVSINCSEEDKAISDKAPSVKDDVWVFLCLIFSVIAIAGNM